jgi:farnesyl diphosphate synthase
MNIIKLINLNKIEFNDYYSKLLKLHLSKDQLSKAMIYGSMNGGKRIRPFLVKIISEYLKINKKNYLQISAAIECIHSYSLIHDDLPSMDNDDFRRGKLSTHKKYNEATAILAGDALHDLAFEIISNKKTHSDPGLRILLVNKLSKIIGFEGLAGGQSLDLLFENKKVNFNQIIKMYEMKTSALFSFCCSAPYILAKKNKKDIIFAENYGKLFGMIFQIIDDVIDEEGDFRTIGKTPGKDKKQGKSTLLSITSKQNIKKYCIDQINNFEIKYKKNYQKFDVLKRLLLMNLKRLD